MPTEELNKRLLTVLAIWLIVALSMGILFGIILTGPNQELMYLLAGIFDISLVCFFGLGFLFVPYLLVEIFYDFYYNKRSQIP